MAARAVTHSTVEEQLREAVEKGCRKPCPVRFWENVYFARWSGMEPVPDRLAQGTILR